MRRLLTCAGAGCGGRERKGVESVDADANFNCVLRVPAGGGDGPTFRTIMQRNAKLSAEVRESHYMLFKMQQVLLRQKGANVYIICADPQQVVVNKGSSQLKLLHFGLHGDVSDFEKDAAECSLFDPGLIKNSSMNFKVCPRLSLRVLYASRNACMRASSHAASYLFLSALSSRSSPSPHRSLSLVALSLVALSLSLS